MSQTRKHLPGHLVIHSIGAVEDNDVPSQGLSKVLHCFRLSRSGGSQGVASPSREHGRAQSHVAPISEGRDDQPAVVSLVLVSVGENTENLLDNTVVLFPVPVESQLGHPIEVRAVLAAHLCKLLDDVPSMDLNGDESDHLVSLNLVEPASGDEGQLVQVTDPLLFKELEGGLAPTAKALAVSQSLLALRGPDDLSGGDEHLSVVFLDPLLLLHALALLKSLQQMLLGRGKHASLNVIEPVLGPALRDNWRDERKVLLILGIDTVGLVEPVGAVWCLHVKLGYTLKALFEMGLDVERVLGLTKNLKQVIRRQKVESWELLSLALQVIVQGLLDALELCIHVHEVVEHAWGSCGLQDVVDVVDLLHFCDEVEVHRLKHGGFLGELPVDAVRADENVLEIHPVPLDLEYHLDCLTHEAEALLPLRDLLLKHKEELAGLHGGKGHSVVLKGGKEVLSAAQLEDASLLVLVRHHVQIESLPGLLNRLERLLDRELLAGVARHVANGVGVLLQLHPDDAREGELRSVGIKLLANRVHELAPVPLPHGRVPEVHDQRHGSLEDIHGLLNVLPDRPGLDFSANLDNALVDADGLLFHVLDVQVAEHAVLPGVVPGVPVPHNLPNGGQQIQVLLAFVELAELGLLHAENVQARLELGDCLSGFCDLVLAVLDVLEGLVDALLPTVLEGGRFREDLSVVRDFLCKVFHHLGKLVPEVFLCVLQLHRRFVQVLLELVPGNGKKLLHLNLLRSDGDLKVLEGSVLLQDWLKAALYLGLLRVKLLLQVDGIRQHVQAQHRLLQDLRVRLEVLVDGLELLPRSGIEKLGELGDPGLTVVDQGLLQRRAIDSQ